MILRYGLDLKTLKMNLHIKNELSGSKFSKVRASITIRQTDTQTNAIARIILQHLWFVTTNKQPMGCDTQLTFGGIVQGQLS